MRNGITSRILFLLGLVLLALVLLHVRLFVSSEADPAGMWYVVPAVALLALTTVVCHVIRLRRWLNELSIFSDASQTTATLPTLPLVHEDDELGRLIHQLFRLFNSGQRDVRQLRTEKKELEALLHTLTDGVVVIDLNGTIVRCNPAALHLFGHDPTRDPTDTWRGRPFHEFSRHPVLHQLLVEDGERPDPDKVATREIEIEGPETCQLAVNVLRLSHTRRAAGQPAVPADRPTTSGYVLTCHDLTPIKQLESVRSDFVANVSHELRTPLTAIKGYAETLLNGAVQDVERAQRFLAIIDRHSERLSRLIDDLLTLSNLELGRTELQHGDLLVAELVEEAIDVVQEKAQRGAVSLSRSIPAGLPFIGGDRDRLHQVLINLIDNAVKYTPSHGRVDVSVILHGRPDTDSGAPLLWADATPGITVVEAGTGQDWLEVAVSDTGCGIPEADIPRLTQRFYRVDKARSRELGGTGLGLAIVKHIVLAHGGGLRIESRVDHGTTVRVALPLNSPMYAQTISSLAPHQSRISDLPEHFAPETVR